MFTKRIIIFFNYKFMLHELSLNVLLQVLNGCLYTLLFVYKYLYTHIPVFIYQLYTNIPIYANGYVEITID